MRYLFSMFMWVLVARWCYSEVALTAPWALPYIDSTLQTLQIPTHDKWSDLKVVQVLKDENLLKEKLAKITKVSPLQIQEESHDTEGLEKLLVTLKTDKNPFGDDKKFFAMFQ